MLMHGHAVNWIDSKATFGSARLHLCAHSSLSTSVRLHAGRWQACNTARKSHYPYQQPTLLLACRGVQASASKVKCTRQLLFITMGRTG